MSQGASLIIVWHCALTLESKGAVSESSFGNVLSVFFGMAKRGAMLTNPVLAMSWITSLELPSAWQD